MITILHIELAKLKRTSIWFFATLLPLLAVVQGQVFLQLLKDRSGGANPWSLLYSGSMFLFAPLVLPILIALLTALVARVEHQQENWKQVFALPVHRGKVYAAKLLLSAGIAAYSLLVLSIGMLGVGWISGLREPIPWAILFGRPALMGLAALPILAVEYFLSYRFHQIVVPLAAAAGLTLPALLAANSARFWILYPWCYPSVLAMSEMAVPTGKVLAALMISGVLFVGISGISLRYLTQRDIV